MYKEEKETVLENNTNESLSEYDLIDLESEDGKPLKFQIQRYFFYNSDEYVVMTEVDKTHVSENTTGEKQDIYIMKVDVQIENGEEIEAFSPIEDNDLYETLENIANFKNEI